MPTRTPAPRVTPPATVEPTSTLDGISESRLGFNLAQPEGWYYLGNERLGLQVAAPPDWIDFSYQARASDWLESFGPQVLFLVDSHKTGENLLAGRSAGDGGFVFGLVSKTISPAEDPAAGLIALLGDNDREGTLVYQRVALDSTDSPAAYVDLDEVPLSQFRQVGQSLTGRLVSTADLDRNVQVFLLMASEPGSLDAYRDTFDKMMHTLLLSPYLANVEQQLASGDQVKGELSESAGQIWPFNGDVGQHATITLTPDDDTIDPTLVLIDPSGNTLASTDDGYAGDSEVLTDIQLPEEGTYTIEISEFFKEGGQYQLSLTLADEPQFGGGGRIEFGREIGSELAENEEHVWVFSGTAGQEVSIVLTSLNDQLDVILEVHGPDGQEEIVLDEGFAGDGEILTGHALSVTGEYMIIVRGFAGRGGAYTMALDEGSESTVNFYDAGDLDYGDDAREFLQQDEAHAWFFEGSAGDQITIEVSPLGSNLDLDIWLMDPLLNDVSMKDEFLAGESEKIEETLQNDGQYLVLVREFFGEPGEYEIRLNVDREDMVEVAGSIEYSETMSGTLPAGRNVGWSFEARPGEIISIVLTPTDPDRDLVLVLLDPQGEIAASADSGLSGLPERISSFRVTEAGEWMILVQEFFNEGSGYELSLTGQ